MLGVRWLRSASNQSQVPINSSKQSHWLTEQLKNQRFNRLICQVYWCSQKPLVARMVITGFDIFKRSNLSLCTRFIIFNRYITTPTCGGLVNFDPQQWTWLRGGRFSGTLCMFVHWAHGRLRLGAQNTANVHVHAKHFQPIKSAVRQMLILK